MTDMNATDNTPHAFVVYGAAGSYSDHSEWFVAVYLDKALADEHARKALESVRELYEWRDADGRSWDYSSDPNKPKSLYDSDPHFVYGDIPEYGVAEVPLLSALPGTPAVKVAEFNWDRSFVGSI